MCAYAVSSQKAALWNLVVHLRHKCDVHAACTILQSRHTCDMRAALQCAESNSTMRLLTRYNKHTTTKRTLTGAHASFTCTGSLSRSHGHGKKILTRRCELLRDDCWSLRALLLGDKPVPALGELLALDDATYLRTQKHTHMGP